ncbi:hypothetical protein D3C85_1559760 [compost metagenome]
MRSSWVTLARNSSFSRLLLASCRFSCSSVRPVSRKVCACCSRRLLMRSASASDSKATSSADPSWLAYMVMNTFGR